MPILEEVKKPVIVNSPDNFTPDGRWLMGETPSLNNYFVACGMNGNSLQVREIFYGKKLVLSEIYYYFVVRELGE